MPETYKNLKKHADGAEDWQKWRDKALATFRREIAVEKQKPSRVAWNRADHSKLVRVLLWEGNVDAAWHEAQEGGCSGELWMQLAAKREKQHPEDALPIYQRQVEVTLGRKNNDAYREAVGLVRKIREVLSRMSREAEFSRYLNAVRLAHKPKRNFIALLDHAKW